MKRILIFLLVCFSYSAIYAQSDKEKKIISGYMDKLIGKLNTKDSILRDELDSLNVKISKIKDRSFTTETPEQKVRKRLAWYDSVPQFVRDYNNNTEFKKLLDTSDLCATYVIIWQMYLSLQETGGYKKNTNGFYKEQIEVIKGNLSILNPPHKDSFMQSFEELSTQIQDYRFTMFELVRVFDLVDENKEETANIYSALQKDGETDFIDKIPFTSKLLKDYIGASGEDKKKIRKLDCFSTIQ